MKKILIAFDGSQGAEAAMLDMRHGGYPERCEAKVFTVADVWLPPNAETNDAGSIDPVPGSQALARKNALAAVAEARRIAQEGAEKLKELFPGWLITDEARSESPAWGILAEARQWGADLVVIGSHGRSPLEKFFLGSVSQKVAAEAPCSVRIYRQHDTTADGEVKILVAVDGSEDSDAAIEEALARDWPEKTKFQLVTIIDQKVKSAAVFDAGAIVSASGRDAAETWVPQMLAARAEKFAKRAFEVSTSILEGEPKGQLLKHARAWKADCIFLGARGLQHGNRLYLGTFASAIAGRADCSVEIVRPRPPSKNALPG